MHCRVIRANVKVVRLKYMIGNTMQLPIWRACLSGKKAFNVLKMPYGTIFKAILVSVDLFGSY